jgi:hypothetical protein
MIHARGGLSVEFATGGQHVQVGECLVDRQHLVERSQLTQGQLPPGPPETGGDGVSGLRAGRDGVEAPGQPLIVVCTSSSIRACTLSVTGP